MYDDSYDRRDSRRLSYVSSPLSETISTPSASRDNTHPSGSSQSQPFPIRTSSIGNNTNKQNGQVRQSPTEQSSPDQETGGKLSKELRRATSTSSSSAMSLNSIDYRSDPATITQELNNLAALRRMSMDVGSADPDLPFNGDFNVPAPKGSADNDDDDTSHLFWVPAHLHPGLAPNEFKSFMDTKLDRIKRTSGDFSSANSNFGSPQRQLSGSGGGLQRKKSMLSRQVHPSDGSPQLDTVSEEPAKSRLRESTTSNFAAEDMPILPLAPPGQNSLRRSTRTTYRKGSFKSGERVPSSRRAPRNFASSRDETQRDRTPSEEPPILGLTRVSTDPTDERQTYNRSSARTRQPVSDGNTVEDLLMDNTSTSPLERTIANSQSSSPEPPVHPEAGPSAQPQPRIPRRTSSHDPPPSLPPQTPLPPEPATARTAKRPGLVPSVSKDLGHNEPGPSQSTAPNTGNNKRTDLLSHLPSLTEEKKADSKKPKNKKEDGGRKSSWHSWRRFTEDKDKAEDKKKKNKAAKTGEKVLDNTRLDVLQTSIDGGPRGRESLVLDRSEVLLDDDEDEKAVGEEPKKEKESWVSTFFGGKKKNGQEKESQKKHTRLRSPEPVFHQPRPDIDYHYTRFPQEHERAIYRMAHLKLANPRRPLRSQVLLSNFMYSYLALVQQMHPHMVSQGRQPGQQDQPEEYSQYQRYQEVCASPVTAMS